MRKTLALLFLMCCGATAVQAQAVLQPLQEDARPSAQHVAPLRMAAAVSLPFFDDFAAASTVPSAIRWLPRGGVYVNNRYAVAPPSINVATFDGLNATGQPYAQGSLNPGASDTLTSQPLQLNSLTPNDSVYLSFYWQSGGLGDVPDRTASDLRYLQLEFKDNTGTWQEVWRQAGVGQVTDFAQVYIAVKETRYFHSNFQFRFRNVGLRNGLADVWNVDYVELDKNRRKGQNTTRDIAISQDVSKLLKHYTSMPARQFRANPSVELATQVRATLNNLGALPGAISWRGYIKQLNRAQADTFLRNQGLVPASARQYELTGTPRVEELALPRDGGFTLLHGIWLNTREQNLLQRANDSTERKTTFANYYAYDDGTAEAGFSFVGTGNVQVAQRYDLNVPDQLSAFRVYFPRIGGKNIAGTSLTFKVWADKDGVPGEMLHQQSFQIQYSEELNAFYEVPLTRLVPLEGSFYIGWSQVGSTFVNIGFDRNERAAGRRFTNTPSEGWAPETVLEGAIMMRPVLVGEALGIEEERAAAHIRVFPNPSNGEVYLNEAYEQVTICDITGKQVYQQAYAGLGRAIDLNHLAAGLYTLRIQTKKIIITKKLILTKL